MLYGAAVSFRESGRLFLKVYLNPKCLSYSNFLVVVFVKSYLFIGKPYENKLHNFMTNNLQINVPKQNTKIFFSVLI